MSPKNNDISQLFSKKFENFQVKTSEQEWLSLSSKLTRRNFLKFSFFTVNIYYLAVLIMFAGTTAYMGVKNIQLSQKVRILEQPLRTSMPTKEISNQPTIASESIDKPESKIQDNQRIVRPKTGSVRNQAMMPASTPGSAKDKESPDVRNEAVKDTARMTIPVEVRPDTLYKSRIKKIKKTLVVKPKVVIVKKDTVVITRSYK